MCGIDLKVEWVVVINEKVLGKKICDLYVKQCYDVVIFWFNWVGVELVVSSSVSLQFGDIFNLVGCLEVIDVVVVELGNVQQKLQQVQMLLVFIGIGFGVLLGFILLFIFGFFVVLKLGLVGGLLIMVLIFGCIGSIGKLYWFMLLSVNLVLCELGIVLFLVVVGLKLGGDFVVILIQGDGLSWIVYGIFIIVILLLMVGVFVCMLVKMNYLMLCGMLVGFMIDLLVLVFVNNLYVISGVVVFLYVIVYLLVMFLCIIILQLFVVLFWGLSQWVLCLDVVQVIVYLIFVGVVEYD